MAIELKWGRHNQICHKYFGGGQITSFEPELDICHC